MVVVVVIVVVVEYCEERMVNETCCAPADKYIREKCVCLFIKPLTRGHEYLSDDRMKSVLVPTPVSRHPIPPELRGSGASIWPGCSASWRRKLPGSRKRCALFPSCDLSLNFQRPTVAHYPCPPNRTRAADGRVFPSARVTLCACQASVFFSPPLPRLAFLLPIVSPFVFFWPCTQTTRNRSSTRRRRICSA